MSGGLSVVFGGLAIFLEKPNPKLLFAILAYLGVWVMAIAIIRKNRAMEGSHKVEIAAQSASHSKEIAVLSKEIALLNEKLAAATDLNVQKEHRKHVLEELGCFHMALSNQAQKIRSMGWLSYAQEYPDDFKDKRLDADSCKILDRIITFLRSEVGTESLAVFLDNIKYEDHTPFAQTEFLREMELYGVRAEELLTKRAALLMQIIQSHLK